MTSSFFFYARLLPGFFFTLLKPFFIFFLIVLQKVLTVARNNVKTVSHSLRKLRHTI